MPKRLYQEIKERIEQAKKGDVPFTEKLQVYLSGVIYGLLQTRAITLKEAEELDRMLEIDRKKIAGVEEFVIFGDIIEFKNSPFEFDK